MAALERGSGSRAIGEHRDQTAKGKQSVVRWFGRRPVSRRGPAPTRRLSWHRSEPRKPVRSIRLEPGEWKPGVRPRSLQPSAHTTVTDQRKTRLSRVSRRECAVSNQPKFLQRVTKSGGQPYYGRRFRVVPRRLEAKRHRRPNWIAPGLLD